MSEGKSAYEIRSQLGHPVIDADGHTTEFVPALAEYLREVGIEPAFDKLFRGVLGAVADWYDVTPEFLREQAEALLIAVRTLHLRAPDGSRPKISASLGVTWQVPDDHTDPEDLLRHADALMYQAKARGRDQLLLEHYPAPAALG